MQLNWEDQMVSDTKINPSVVDKSNLASTDHILNLINDLYQYLKTSFEFCIISIGNRKISSI